MIFIDKSTQHSQDSKKRLDDWKINFRSNGETLEQLYLKKGQTGTALWKKVRSIKKRLRDDLSIEQTHICCYCGQKLKSETRIEHFLSKANNTEFHIRVFNYDNLLLSCEGEYFDKIQYYSGRLETLEEFTIRNNVTVDDIEELNPNKDLSNLNTNDKIRCGKDHCDPFKGQIEDKERQEIPIINPTKFLDCWKYFKFDSDGGISVNDDEIIDITLKSLVVNSIRVLNLNVKALIEKRKKALTNFEDDWTNAAEAYQYDINSYFSDQFHNPKQPFCFVNYHFIQQLMM